METPIPEGTYSAVSVSSCYGGLEPRTGHLAYGEVCTMSKTKARLGLVTTYHQTGSTRTAQCLYQRNSSSLVPRHPLHPLTAYKRNDQPRVEQIQTLTCT